MMNMNTAHANIQSETACEAQPWSLFDSLSRSIERLCLTIGTNNSVIQALSGDSPVYDPLHDDKCIIDMVKKIETLSQQAAQAAQAVSKLIE